MSRRAAEGSGLALVSLSIAIGVALATWSVRDPSISHATHAPVRNALGVPGAVIADLLMQLAGLGSLVALVTIALWGWKLVQGRTLDQARLRLLCGIVGVCAACGLASALPATDRWPLPTGLGGVFGDAILTMPARFLALEGVFSRGIWSFGLLMAAILCISFAVRSRISEQGAAAEKPPKPRTARDRDHDDTDDEPSTAIISVGAVIHAFMSTRAAFRRRLARWRNSEKRPVAPREWAHMQPSPAQIRPPRTQPGVEKPKRIEPVLGNPAAQPPVPVTIPVSVGAYHRAPMETAIPTPHVEIVPESAEPGAQRLRRVSVDTPAIKPGKRMEREQQISLLDGESYQLPPLTLLAEPKRNTAVTISTDALEQNARLLEGVLEDFGVRGEIINVRPGPVVTLYELEPAPGVKSSRVIGLADDIARSMSAISARVAVVQGRNAIGIELPNQKREMVYFRELLASQDFESTKFRLPIALGKTIGGEPVIVELAKMPHLMIAGTTGSGKSVAINTMILSLLYRLKPEECRLIMIDPKMLELSVYDGIPHLLTPVVTDPKKAVVALKWAVREMEERYKKMSKVGVRNIDGFNVRLAEAKAKNEVITRTVQTGFDRETGEPVYETEEMSLEALPYIVVIVDEMADLMMVAGKDVEGAIQRLAQMARAAGIHLIMATQRPSVDVITGTIKANFPTRISFQVTSKIDSRTILGEQGAEQLLGQGDMLHMAGGGRISRVHGPFCSDDEVEKIVAHLKTQGRPHYLENVLAEEDDVTTEADEDGAVFDKGSFGEEGGDSYDQAVKIVLRDKKCSTSYIQRRLQIGYNRAASLVERMEKEGIVGPANHAGKREILIQTPERDDDD